VTAQQSVRLELNPKLGNKYVYRAEGVLSDNDVRIATQTSMLVDKNSSNNFLIKESLDEVNLFGSSGEQIFSLNALFEIGDDKFNFQQIAKYLKPEREVTALGETVKEYDIDSVLINSGYADALSNKFLSFFDLLKKNNEFFYLNRKLEKGASFKFDREFTVLKLSAINIPITYTVFEINDKRTVLTSKLETEISIDKRGNKEKLVLDGIFIIENETGLPLYYAEISEVGSHRFVYSVSRDNYKSLSCEMYNSMARQGNSWNDDMIDISGWGNTSMRYQKKEDAENALKKLKLEAFLDKDAYSSSTKLNIGSKESILNFMFTTNNANCLYCNKESRQVKNQNNQPFIISSTDGYGEVTDVFTGRDCMVEKLVADFNVETWYGVKKREFGKKDVGKLQDLNSAEFVLSDWQDKSLVMTNVCFMAYDSLGNQLTKASVIGDWPQYKAVSDLLAVDKDQVTTKQAWLYSSLFEEYHIPLFFKVTFEEPVAKLVVLDFKGSVSANKTVEASNSSEVRKVLEERARERFEEERAKNEEEQRSKDNIEEEEGLEEVVETLGSNSKNEKAGGVEEEESVFVIVEQMPKFPGGMTAYLKYVQEHIQYPKEAAEQNITGRVFVSFIIEKDGKISHVKVVRGVHDLLDKEAIRVIESSPAWQPGIQRGIPVRVSYIQPVNFVL
jgi:TonB family protein